MTTHEHDFYSVWNIIFGGVHKNSVTVSGASWQGYLKPYSH